jgi:hypothetical protein
LILTGANNAYELSPTENILRRHIYGHSASIQLSVSNSYAMHFFSNIRIRINTKSYKAVGIGIGIGIGITIRMPCITLQMSVHSSAWSAQQLFAERKIDRNIESKSNHNQTKEMPKSLCEPGRIY